ncbi:MAG TPA: hypothetical protein P5519_00215 [Spirochaetia bacterium]|nr:hypothetical protein [Spirochaetales bacterium]HRS64294.1 hypothetical protein [Spirochaetia bacterium]HOT58321.1 hypothetical protein [Spirochaetales bacterium]HPD80073.1 hypothetical protein [Spirochaetales bacterium]HQG39509.1 hypothetical protein [Spirochaetales bacterium]
MIKKLIVRLILLLIVSLIVFFFGWINWRIQPGCFAIYISKTSGIQHTVIKPGDFVWKLEALLPTNVKLLQFKPLMYTDSFELTGTLPSAEAYKAFIGGNPDFSWKLSVSCSISYNYDSLPELYENAGISSSEQLEELLKQQSPLIMQTIQEQLFILTPMDVTGMLQGEYTVKIREILSKKFPDLYISNISVKFIQLPDISTYTVAANLYENYIEKFQKALEPALLVAASKAVQEQVELEQLRKYGELFKQYPELIQYMAIKAGIYLQKP